MLSEAQVRNYIYTISREISSIKNTLPQVIRNYEESAFGEEFSIVSLSELSNKFNEIEEKHVNEISSVDSSTRYLRDTTVGIVMTGMATFSTKEGLILAPYDKEIRFLGISANKDILTKIEDIINTKHIAIRNYIGDYFDQDYRLDDVADELRLESENSAIDDMNGLIIMDGPIYPTPLELTNVFEFRNMSRETHRKAYASLVRDRLNKIKDKEVIGIVKRLENSKKLYKLDEIQKILGKLPPITDPEVLRLLYHKLCKGESICILGPFMLSYQINVEGILKDVPPKYAYYVIVKRIVGPSSFFRVESLNLNTLQYIKSIFSRISCRGIPTWIEIVDTASKKISSSLFIIGYEISSSFLDIIHDDKLAFDTEVRSF
ncbi:DNA double-strand break repair nuclease NurA [Acidianus brierleyi]|uniref:NurA domain-containing protein n=1 Tax=Acidianus brierleyi TaxID=41673 RepID=A0A2U9IDR2_9CREN|nr:DNA double-strand break repair nuclease NurA [Acidianus brierleyi]AWR94165.1 hypothetical protein DFR85_05725 [Acidianus brierleyi]